MKDALFTFVIAYIAQIMMVYFAQDGWSLIKLVDILAKPGFPGFICSLIMPTFAALAINTEVK